VSEYFQYDPTGDYLDPQLKGFRLVQDNYFPIPATRFAENSLTLFSEVLKLELRLQEGEFRFYDPATFQILLTYQETEQARREAEQRAEQAAQRSQQLADKLRELGIDPESL
jgi:hypothetical protein